MSSPKRRPNFGNWSATVKVSGEKWPAISSTGITVANVAQANCGSMPGECAA